MPHISNVVVLYIYVVLNAERFFLYTFVIPSIALFKERNTLPVPYVAMGRTLMHSHTPCHFFRLSERVVNNILG
jgi:hypothetical protein